MEKKEFVKNRSFRILNSSLLAKICIIMASVVIGLLAAEAVIWIFLKILDGGHKKSSLPTAIDNEKLYYEKVLYDPYRWYRLPPYYSGKTIQTDWLGFRNGPVSPVETHRDRIAIYGGSTVFSTATDQQYTLTSLLQKQFPKGPQFLNFGIGGYASSAELCTFLETSRLISGIRVAIFYDGVNEVARYAEKMQDGRNEPYWQVVSYPYASVLECVLTDKKSSSDYLQFPFTVFILKKIIQKRIKCRKSFSPEDYSQASETIARIYLNNIRDIESIAKARGIQTVFVLQPVIYTTDNLSPSESKIAEAQYQVDMKKLYLLSYSKIRSAAEGSGVDFMDMSQALSEKYTLQAVYTDMCHLNEAGQEFMAKKIAKTLLKKYPEYFSENK